MWIDWIVIARMRSWTEALCGGRLAVCIDPLVESLAEDDPVRVAVERAYEALGEAYQAMVRPICRA